MAKLKVFTAPAPILRKKAAPVTKITPKIRELVKGMFELMYETEGIGLAAPQVGISQKIIAIDIEEYDPLEPPPMVLVNPKIIDWSDEAEIAEEGCLSLPEILNPVRRAKRVTVEAMMLSGETIVFEGEELMARVLQHEIDHLEGILFTDRVNEEDTKLFKKQKARSIFGRRAEG